MTTHHLSNPVLASLDLAGVAALLGYWTGGIEHPIAVISTGLAGIWYCLRIFEDFERRIKRWRK